MKKSSRCIKTIKSSYIYFCATVLLSCCHFHTRIQARLQIVMHSSSESHVYVRTFPSMCIKISFECFRNKMHGVKVYALSNANVSFMRYIYCTTIICFNKFVVYYYFGQHKFCWLYSTGSEAHLHPCRIWGTILGLNNSGS
jgi:hypothetical protein